MSWNGYPKRVRNLVIKRLETNKSNQRETENDDRYKIWLDLRYNGTKGEQLVTFLIQYFNWLDNVIEEKLLLSLIY